MRTWITADMVNVTETFASEVFHYLPVVLPASTIGKYILVFIGIRAAVYVISLLLFPKLR